MGPKKKKAGGKGKGAKITADDDDLRSWNLQQREVLVDLMNRLNELKTVNFNLRNERKEALLKQIENHDELVSLPTLVTVCCLGLPKQVVRFDAKQETGKDWQI
jgi:hypothetical protein